MVGSSILTVSVLAVTGLVGVAAARPAGAAEATGELIAQEHAGRAPAVSGSWELTIQPSPGSGLPPEIKALITFDAGGGCVETVLLAPVTSAHGVWERINRRRFEFAVVHHLVDPQGNFTGTVRAKSFAVFVGRNQFQADFEGALYDPAGNLVAPVSGTEHAKRIALDAL
jgi:hypothetical protein